MKIVTLIILMVFACGCLPKNAFAPPPYTYEHWVKPGADEVTVWKDMLECNYSDPFGGGVVSKADNEHSIKPQHQWFVWNGTVTRTYMKGK